jgi:MFS family permease
VTVRGATPAPKNFLNDLGESSAPRSLWLNRDFVKLWIATTISLFGTPFTRLAVPLIAVLMLQASPSEMGLLSALQTVPFLLFGLVAGVWVDRVRRRGVLIAGDLGRALVLATLPLSALAGVLSMPLLYAVSFLFGVLTVFFDVAFQSYVPAIVRRTALVEANSKLEMSSSTAQVMAPGLAGFIVHALSAPIAVVIDAGSFVVSAAFIGLIRAKEPAPDEAGAPLLTGVRDGIVAVFGNRLLRAIAGCSATINLFASAISALSILYASRELALTPAAIGMSLTIGNVGAVVGALLAAKLASRLGVGPLIIAAAMLGAISPIPMILATPSSAFTLLILSQILFSFASPVYDINQVSLRQAITPQRLLGRMNATMRFLVWGSMPIGSLLGGELGEWLGLRTALALATVIGLTAFLWVLCSPVRTLRRIPEPDAS